MADSYSAEITNLPAFDAAMVQIHHDLENMKGPLDAAAQTLAARAAQAAPKLSGTLAGAHRALPAGPKQVRITADTPYAAVIHWGWPGHGIRRRPWAVATWERDPTPRDRMADAIQHDLDKAAAKT